MWYRIKFKTSRGYYLTVVLIVILLGICSRKLEVIPLFIGDLLYAIMMFFIIRMLFLKSKKSNAAWLALTICYAIEFSQLYQADWILRIRESLIGRYVLGQGFLWSDCVAYTFGVAIAYSIDSKTNP